MKEWPEFNKSGDLPIGIHPATLAEVIDHFGRDYEGASIFWVRRMAAFGGEDNAVAFWQGKRNGDRRGIVEVISYD